MYYPPLFAPVRPFESQPSAVDVPVAAAATGRENPLDLSTKPIRPNAEPEAEADLLMLDHRKLASLAATHSLSRSAAAPLMDPSLYRLAYGPESLVVPAPFCYDRATGVAVPTSLAGHQLMSSYLQQRERCLEQQQAAMLAARSLLDPASLPYGLRTAMSQREAAAALAATRGLYTPAMPTPMVLPAFSLYTDDKGAFSSLRNGGSDKPFLNGTTAGGALEAARFAEHLQRLREHSGKCGNACCSSLPGLGATVPCACCMQSPSQAALCARSPLGCIKDPTTAATGKLCSTTCDYLQPGLTFLHRPTAATPTIASFTSSSTEVTTTAPVFQPGTTWSTGLPSVSTPGKTAFSVPKKKDSSKGSPSHKESKVLNGFTEKESTSQESFKRETDKTFTVIKKEPSREKDSQPNEATPHNHRREHDVKSILSPKTTASSIAFPRVASQFGTALTTVTASTPVVPTKCEGGTIPKTKMPPVLEPCRPSELSAQNGEHADDTPTVPSPQGPPPLIAVPSRSHHGVIHPKDSHLFSLTDASAIRHQSHLHGTTTSTPAKSSAIPSDPYKSQKSPKKSSSAPKTNGLPAYMKEEPSSRPPVTLPKPVPQIPTAHHMPNAHFSSHFRPYSLQDPSSWIPPASPNVTVSPAASHPKSLLAATATGASTTSTSPVNGKTVVKSEPLPLVSVKKEPDNSPLLVRPATTNAGFQPVQPSSVIMSNRSPYSALLEYHQYHHQMIHGLNLTHRGLVESGSPAAASTAPVEKVEPKLESSKGLDLVSSKKRPRDRSEDSNDSKKRIAKMEYAMAPGFAFQYPPYPIGDPNDVPLCPYTFVDPQSYYDNPVVVPREVIRPVKSACGGSSSAEGARPLKEEGAESSGPLEPALSPRTILHLKNIRRSAQARARSKLRKRILARIYSRRRQAKAPARGRRRARIRSGLDMALRRKRRLGKAARPVDACRAKALHPASSLAMPAEMKKLMANKALGETVLHRASRLGYPEVVAYCLETNCGNVNAPDNAGYTPLHECCSRGHLDIARALLQYGADVNASAAGGIRPLHDAVENDHVELVRLLLSFGADPSIATYSGLTPLKLARSPLMAEFLQGFMSDISGEVDSRPHLPWRFWGSASCLDPIENGYDTFDGVPSDGEADLHSDADDFLFEVSDSPHLPTFRMAASANSKAQSNFLRLSDVLRKTGLNRAYFLEHFRHIEVLAVPRHEFEASATCSQLLAGSKLDAVFPYDDGLDSGNTVDLVRLDGNIRKVLGIETISVR